MSKKHAKIKRQTASPVQAVAKSERRISLRAADPAFAANVDPDKAAFIASRGFGRT